MSSVLRLCVLIGCVWLGIRSNRLQVRRLVARLAEWLLCDDAPFEMVELVASILVTASRYLNLSRAGPVLLELVAPLLSHVHHAHVETAKVVQQCLAEVASANWSAADAAHLRTIILNQVSDRGVSVHVNWHVRLHAVKFLAALLPRHALVSTTGLHSLQAVTAFLLDEQPEVVEATAGLLSSCWAVMAPAAFPGGGWWQFGNRFVTPDERQEEHVEWAWLPSYPASVHEQRGSADQTTASFLSGMKKWAAGKTLPDPSKAALYRAAGVLGTIALARSEPYAIPSWLPGVLEWLATLAARHPNGPLAGPLQRFFQEFRRTHTDDWDAVQLCFSDAQLEAIRNVQAAASYIA